LCGGVSETAAFTRYQATRDRMLADVFDITCALCEFPQPTRFLQLHGELGRAVDIEAAALAERPLAAHRTLAA
jgi:hypothetical protein